MNISELVGVIIHKKKIRSVNIYESNGSITDLTISFENDGSKKAEPKIKIIEEK